MCKKLLAIIFSLAVLSGCAAEKSTEITETSGTSSIVTSAGIPETTVTETAAASEEAEDADMIGSIKEALKAEWNNSVYYVQMYAEDLNGDGVKELFVNYSPKLSAECGVTYIFDVSDGVERLYKISLMTAKGDLYTDESGGLHYIMRTGYSDGMDRSAYYDVAYDKVEIPFYADTKGVDDVKVYKNCQAFPNKTLFISSKAEFVGNFERKGLYRAWFDGESSEISELIQSEVFDGLTYASEAAAVYLGRDFENFEDFIMEAEPKLKLVYGDAEPADTSGVDYIKEALKAEWNDDVRVVNLYTADLNGDGIKELFVNYSFGVAMNGSVYVYDVSDGVKKLYEIPARIWAGSVGVYKDNDEKTCVIIENGYGSTSLSEQDYAVFNISYDELKQPLFADVYDWYNGGAHIHEYDLYRNCEIVPDARVFDGERNFDPEKAEYIGRYDLTDVWKAFEKKEENGISEIIQKEVYEGLTYISDMEELYRDSGYTADSDTSWEFEYFWQGAAPILSEAYGNTSAVTEEKLPVNTGGSGINADGTLNEAFTQKIIGLIEPMPRETCYIYPSLWDFNEDGVPEIILTFFYGGQGNMPCKVYDSGTLEQIGEFEGFCRDGFTRFVNGYGLGTIIYSCYEHSNFLREETVEFVRMEHKKLVSNKKISRLWETRDTIFPNALILVSDNSEEANYSERDFMDYNFGDVCTSYNANESDIKKNSESAVESYNNYIKIYKITKEEYPVGCAFIGQKNEAAVYEIRGEGFFMDENGGITPLESNMPYVNIYKLGEDIIVCEQFGNTSPCDVYIMVDGKPVLDEKISGQGHACLLSRSKLYNGGFEITDSVYDAASFGVHTFKTYQLYRDKDGFHEYGSIVVPIEDFNKYYGEAAQVFVDDIAEKWGVNGVSVDIEIYEVLYRSDNSFILNCRSPLTAGDNDDICGYDFYNITLKPNTKGGLTEVYRDRGVYKTALIPEIAVYPEKMYVPEAEG